MAAMTPVIKYAARFNGGFKQKEAVWTEIVTEKIRKQKELLEFLGKDESKLLHSYLQEIRME